MNFRVLLRAFLLPGLCLGLLTAPVHAGNPLKTLGSSLKKVSRNLNPWKKAIAPRAEPAAARPATKASTAKPAAKASPNNPLAKSAKPTKATSGPKVVKGQSVATAPKPKSRTSQSVAARNAAGAAGAAGPEKPADPLQNITAQSSPENLAEEDAPVLPEPKLVKPPANYPFATPVMGRKGHVRSPFAEDQGMVDVSDIPAGTKVRCPYTGKVFRVP